jgi:tRNA(His) guanylyltransferase
MASLAERMKSYESAEAGRRLLPLVPAMARLDGRGFSRFTRDLARPFDERFSRLMIATCRWLVRETHALVGYTQSDEITLTWYAVGPDAQVFFDGRIQKMVSQLAALATAWFNRQLPNYLPAEYGERLPTFDARVWNVPNLTEAAQCYLWRERDATRNSVSMAAQAVFPHAELLGKTSRDMRWMLLERGVDWEAYPTFFRRGTYVRPMVVERPFTVDTGEAPCPSHSRFESATYGVACE